jgi:hypothetical protein
VGVDPADPRFGLAPDPFWEPYREAHGVMRRVSRRLDLARLLPRPELAASGSCLAAPGAEYLVYVPAPATELPMDLVRGAYAATWLDPVTGAPVATAPLTAPGGWSTLRCPAGEGAALHAVRVP